MLNFNRNAAVCAQCLRLALVGLSIASVGGCISQTKTTVSQTSTLPAAFDVRSFGATPNDESSDTKAIQKAIDSAAAKGGGTVVIAGGNYVSGTLWMKSNVHLLIDAGTTLLGSQDITEWPEWRSDWEGPNAAMRRAAMFAGERLENVSLTGYGTVDARGAMWWTRH